MDCFGTFWTTPGGKPQKRYGRHFYSRVIHIEGMSTNAFINGLTCFIALSAVRQIKCDQDTNFIWAKIELNAALKELDLNRQYISHKESLRKRQIKTVQSALNPTQHLSPRRLCDNCTLFSADCIEQPSTICWNAELPQNFRATYTQPPDHQEIYSCHATYTKSWCGMCVCII